MKNVPRYPIPLSWDSSSSGLTLPWDTPVLPLNFDVSLNNMPFQVERIPNTRSKHIPEKRPLFRIEFGRSHEFISPLTIKVSPVALGTLRVGTHVLVELPTENAPRVEKGGVIHGVRILRGSWAIPFCSDDSLYDSQVTEAGLTCRHCARFQTAWVCLTISEHVDPRSPTGAAKDRLREQQAIERRQRRGRSIYDWLRAPQPHSEPPPKKAPARPPVPELDPFADFETSPRDIKLARQRDRDERFREAKRKQRGH